jgi:outer membrane protein OmpA-like peptidoglycan-associated protein
LWQKYHNGHFVARRSKSLLLSIVTLAYKFEIVFGRPFTMKYRLALAAATCLALPLAMHSTAQAQPVTGPYVSLGAGTALEIPSASDYQDSYSYSYNFGDYGGTDHEKFSFKNQFKPSYAGVIAAGYGFGNGFRVELGGDFIRNTVWNTFGHYTDNYTEFSGEDGAGSGAESYDLGKYNATGGEDKYGPMVNAYYDFSVGLPIYPYIGAGVGYQWVKLNRDYRNDAGVKVGGTKGSFAYEIIAGLSYPLPTMPQLSLTAEYRFMQLVQSRNYALEIPAGDAEPDESYSKFKMGQESYHMFLVGLRYQLFPPPVMAPPVPAPMASPAPAAAKTYLVFFDWDKYALTPRADAIIAEAASDSKTNSTTTIDVSGYTDTSGTPTYNQGLSERRAKAVAAKLVVDGVPASEISIHAYGETHLLVPTGPGVREPQNRRVEIVLN